MTHYNCAVGTTFLARDSHRLLLNFRTSKTTFPRHWGLWSGKVEEGESPLHALFRECKEELAIDVPPHALHPWDIYTNEKNCYTFYTFISVVDAEFTPVLNTESEGYGWFNYDALPYPLHPGIKRSLIGWKARRRLEMMVS